MAVQEARRKMVVKVRSVFDYNVEQEFSLIKQVADSYRYVALDTEFPGVVYPASVHPMLLSAEQRYLVVKKNVDNLKLIQLGLTLATSDKDDGEVLSWEFNLRGFDPEIDAQAPDSVQLLKSQGIDLLKNYTHGVDPDRFADLFWSSGLVGDFSKTWITFHGAYDFAFLIKILLGTPLPDSMHSFLSIVACYFGFGILDVKHLSKSCNGVYGGLENVAKILKVERVTGRAHQAGSDSLFIWNVYKKMRNVFFNNGIGARHAQILCGIQDL